MSFQRQDYKNLFRSNLMPFMDMLQSQQNDKQHQEWIKQVSRTFSSIVSNPEQYVGQEMPSLEIVVELITEIFEEFIREHSPSEVVFQP